MIYDPIMNALQRATKMHPISIEALRNISDREEIDVVALYTLLDQMHIAGKVGRVSGMREGKPVLSYWPLVELVPAASTAPAAWPNKSKEPTMKRQIIPHALGDNLLAHIADHPGLTGKELNRWVSVNVSGATRSHIKHALCDLLDAKRITSTGKTAGMRYFSANIAADAAPKAAGKPAAAAASRPERRPAPNDLEHATRAAQCADLLAATWRP